MSLNDLQRTTCYYSIFWIHGNFMFWMTRGSVCNPSYWNSMAGFLIQTTGTLKLEDGLKNTNRLRRRPARKNKKEIMEAQLYQ